MKNIYINISTVLKNEVYKFEIIVRKFLLSNIHKICRSFNKKLTFDSYFTTNKL